MTQFTQGSNRTMFRPTQPNTGQRNPYEQISGMGAPSPVFGQTYQPNPYQNIKGMGADAGFSMPTSNPYLDPGFSMGASPNRDTGFSADFGGVYMPPNPYEQISGMGYNPQQYGQTYQPPQQQFGGVYHPPNPYEQISDMGYTPQREGQTYQPPQQQFGGVYHPPNPYEQISGMGYTPQRNPYEMISGMGANPTYGGNAGANAGDYQSTQGGGLPPKDNTNLTPVGPNANIPGAGTDGTVINTGTIDPTSGPPPGAEPYVDPKIGWNDQAQSIIDQIRNDPYNQSLVDWNAINPNVASRISEWLGGQEYGTLTAPSPTQTQEVTEQNIAKGGMHNLGAIFGNDWLYKTKDEIGDWYRQTYGREMTPEEINTAFAGGSINVPFLNETKTVTTGGERGGDLITAPTNLPAPNPYEALDGQMGASGQPPNPYEALDGQMGASGQPPNPYEALDGQMGASTSPPPTMEEAQGTGPMTPEQIQQMMQETMGQYAAENPGMTPEQIQQMMESTMGQYNQQTQQQLSDIEQMMENTQGRQGRASEIAKDYFDKRNQTADGSGPPDLGGDTYQWQAPEDKFSEQIGGMYQNVIDMLNGGAEIPGLAEITAGLQQSQDLERQELEQNLALRGVSNSTSADEARNSLAVRQRGEMANAKTQQMTTHLQNTMGPAAQMFSQEAQARGTSLQEYLSFLDRQFRSDTTRTGQDQQALALMLNALGVGTINPQMPSMQVAQGAPGAGESAGNLLGNLATSWISSGRGIPGM